MELQFKLVHLAVRCTVALFGRLGPGVLAYLITFREPVSLRKKLELTDLLIQLHDLEKAFMQFKGLCVLQAGCKAASTAEQGLTKHNTAAINKAIGTAIHVAWQPCLSSLSEFRHWWTAQYEDLRDQIIYAEEQLAACKINTYSTDNTAILAIAEEDDETIDLEQLYRRLHALQSDDALTRAQAHARFDIDTTLQQLKCDLEQIDRVPRNSNQPADVAVSSTQKGTTDQVRDKRCIIAHYLTSNRMLAGMHTTMLRATRVANAGMASPAVLCSCKHAIICIDGCCGICLLITTNWACLTAQCY